MYESNSKSLKPNIFPKNSRQSCWKREWEWNSLRHSNSIRRPFQVTFSDSAFWYSSSYINFSIPEHQIFPVHQFLIPVHQFFIPVHQFSYSRASVIYSNASVFYSSSSVYIPMHQYFINMIWTCLWKRAKCVQHHLLIFQSF